MKKAFPIILIGFVLITVLDILSSIASRQMNFNYSSLSPISFVIYTIIPFLIAKRSNRKAVIISGALLALFDATIGLRLSIMFQANTGSVDMNTYTPAVLIAMAIVMLAVGSLCGLLGYWLSTKFKKNKTAS